MVLCRLLLLGMLFLALGAVWSARVYAAGEDDPVTAWSWSDGGAESTAGVRAIAVDDCGNTYVSGIRGGAAGPDMLLISYAPDGFERWRQQYDGPGHGQDEVSKMILDSQDRVVVTGYSQGAGGVFETVTLQYAANGALLWVARHAASDRGVGLDVDPGGNVYVSARAREPQSGIFLLKYSPEGELLWAVRNQAVPGMQDAPGPLAVDGPDAFYVAAEYTAGLGQPSFSRVMRFDAAGGELWRRSEAGVQSNLVVQDLVSDPVGGVILTGYYPDGAGKPRAMTLRYDRLGGKSWQSEFTGAAAGSDLGGDVAVDEEGRVTVSISAYDGQFNADSQRIVLARLAPGGQPLWEQSFNSPFIGSHVPAAITLDPAGRPYVGLPVRPSQAVQVGVRTVALSNSGSVRWSRDYLGTSTYGIQFPILAVDGAGSVYLGASGFRASPRLGNLLIRKYDAGGPVSEPELIDANPEYTQQVRLPLTSIAGVEELGSASWAALQRRPSSIAADGVTLVLLRVEVPVTAGGAAHFRIISSRGGSLWPITAQELRDTTAAGGKRDLQSEGSQELAVSTYLVNGKRWAFALYRSPRDFDLPGPPRVSVDVSREVHLAVCVPGHLGRGFGQEIRKTLNLIRPLVLLVHGTFSSPDTWTQFPLFRKSRTELNGWRTPAEAPFAVSRLSFAGLLKATGPAHDSARELLPQIETKIRAWSLAVGAAATQADVVTHSFGGVVMRVAAGIQRESDFTGRARQNFRALSNWGHGPVHKLITVGATHRGAAVVNHMALLNKVHQGSVTSFTSLLGYSFNSGAMADQFVASAAARLLNRPTPFPGHAIVGSGDLSLTAFFSAEYWMYELMQLLDPGTGPYDAAVEGYPQAIGLQHLANFVFNMDYNVGSGDGGLNPNYDLVVGARSMMGGLSGSAVSTFNKPLDVGRLPHAGQTVSQTISDRVEALLATNIAGPYFQPFPAFDPARSEAERRLENLSKPEWLDAQPVQSLSGTGKSGPTLTTDAGTAVTPGQAVHVSVSWAGKTISNALLVTRNGEDIRSDTLEGAQPASDVAVPNNAVGSFTLCALVRATDGTVASTQQELPISDNNTYLRLATEPAELRFSGEGSLALCVYGELPDGSWRDLTQSTATQVTSNNPGIVEVDPAAGIRPVGVGSTSLSVAVAGSGSRSVPVIVTVLPPPAPAPPSGLTALPTTAAVRLTWNDNSATEDGFEIQRRSDNGTFFTIGAAGAGAGEFTDAGVSSKSSYGYRIRAVNVTAASAYSPEVRVTTLTVEGGKLKVVKALNFGKVKMGTARIRQLKLQNLDRRTPLVVALDAPVGDGYVLEGAGVFTLPPRAIVNIPVTFSATAPGKRNGTVAIRSGDLRKRSVTVRLAATVK